MKLYYYDDNHTSVRSYNDSFSHTLKSKVYNEYMKCIKISRHNNGTLFKYHVRATISSDYSFNGRWISARINLDEEEIKFMYWQMEGWRIKKKLRIKLGLFPMVEFKGR